MGHVVRVFAGPLVALRASEQISQNARLYALTPYAPVFVQPFDEDVEDSVYRLQGTRDWLETGPRISTGAIAFAVRASRGASIGYLETEYFGGVSEQSAVLWHDGVLASGPPSISSHGSAVGLRSRSLWPVSILYYAGLASARLAMTKSLTRWA